MDAAGRIIVFDNCLSQEVISLFGTVSVESGGVCHFIHCFVHSFDASSRQGTGDVADAQADKALSGMRYFKRIYFFCLALFFNLIVRLLDER